MIYFSDVFAFREWRNIFFPIYYCFMFDCFAVFLFIALFLRHKRTSVFFSSLHKTLHYTCNYTEPGGAWLCVRVCSNYRGILEWCDYDKYRTKWGERHYCWDALVWALACRCRHSHNLQILDFARDGACCAGATKNKNIIFDRLCGTQHARKLFALAFVIVSGVYFAPIPFILIYIFFFPAWSVQCVNSHCLLFFGTFKFNSKWVFIRRL